MGRPVKLSDKNKAWFVRRGCRDRITESREERRRFLIVCEGEKTEPNYFQAFGEHLPKRLVELKIFGAGTNTLSLIRQAQGLRDERMNGDYPYDEVWVVFDRDSFPPDDFDNAIHMAETDEIKCAWSNEAFELWYILHFEYRTTSMPRADYQAKLTQLLSRKYQKNSVDMYQQLAKNGNQAQAIIWAHRLHKEDHDGKPPSRANPCTTVYQLVEELNRFKSPHRTSDEDEVL